MGSLTFEIFFVISLSLLNGLLAMSELAVVSSNRSRLVTLANGGHRQAKAALALVDNSPLFLATVQIGITLVGIVAGVFGGAAIAADVSALLQEHRVSPGLAETLSYFLVVGGITYFSVVIGELVPKQLALANPERIALIVAIPLLLFSRIFRPVVWLLQSSSSMILRCLPFKAGRQVSVSEDDIRSLISQGTDTGEIRPAEKNMAFRVFRLADRPVHAFMTIRREVVWLDSSKPFAANWELAMSVPHSFFPVCGGTVDNLEGMISVKDLCVINGSCGTKELADFVRPALRVPSMKDALSVLEDFKRERRQMAVIVDEHGGVSGVVTTHDILEALVGDLPDFEGEEPSIVERGDGSFLVDSTMDIQEVLLQLGEPVLGSQDSTEFHSVGGVLFKELSSYPKVGAQVRWNGLTLEVVDMDGYRIDKVLVSREGSLTPSSTINDGIGR